MASPNIGPPRGDMPHGFFPNPTSPDITWRAYCFDDTKPDFVTVHDPTNTRPADLPTRVVVILQMLDETGEVDLLQGGEFFVLDHEGRWKGADEEDVEYQRVGLARPYPAVHRGYWANTGRFRRILDLALHDEDFPQWGFDVAAFKLDREHAKLDLNFGSVTAREPGEVPDA